MRLLLLLTLLITPLFCQTIDVTTYGAKPDGGTDATAAIENAFAAARAKIGSEVYFPCGPNGEYYLITRPITFPSFTTVRGTNGYGCQIIYRSTSSADAAFSLVGSTQTTIRDLGLYTLNEDVIPSTILMLGGVHGQDGQHSLDHVSIGGYATRAMVYSVSSENNTFRNVYFDLRGGGTQIGFYTSAKDDWGLCSACQDGSNLSLTMEAFVFANGPGGKFTAIEDKTEGGTGDHYYEHGYIGLLYNSASVGFTFISGDSSHGGPNSRIAINDVRIENGGSGVNFVKDYQTSISNVDMEGLTWDTATSGAGNFINGESGLTLANMRWVKNLGENHAPTATSSIDSLVNSTVMEDYGKITIRSKASGNCFIMTGNGALSMPSTATNAIMQPSKS